MNDLHALASFKALDEGRLQPVDKGDVVTVTPEDREAARQWWLQHMSLEPSESLEMAFARHRHQSETGAALTSDAEAADEIASLRASFQATAEAAAFYLNTVASLRARVEGIEEALEKLIVAVEFEVPPIRDGVDVDRRLDVLALSAREAHQALKDSDNAQ